MFTKTSRWVPTDPGPLGHVWIGFEPHSQEDAVIPRQAARKGARGEGRNLVLECELLLLARERVETLWAHEDEQDGEGDEKSD